jgi:ABC-2 type transport system permease protein
MRIIQIHVVRSLRRYARSRMNLIVALAQPLLYLLALGFGLGPTFEDAGRGSYLQFLAPGIAGMATLFSAIGAGVELMVDSRFGILRQALVAPISRLTLMAARTTAGAMVATVQGTLVLAACMLVGFRPASLTALLAAPLFLVLIALLFSGLSTAIAARLTDMNNFQFVVNFVIMPLFFFSATLYPPNNMPQTMRFFVDLNPLTYGVDGLRTVLAGSPTPFGIAVDLVVMGLATSAVLGLGARQFARLEL